MISFDRRLALRWSERRRAIAVAIATSRDCRP